MCLFRDQPNPGMRQFWSRLPRAWGDNGAGQFKPGAISEPAAQSLGRYRSRPVQAWGDSGVGGFMGYAVAVRSLATCAARIAARAGLKTGGPGAH